MIKVLFGILVIVSEILVITSNPSKCDKSCDIGEYLDYENCNCTKKLVDKLV